MIFNSILIMHIGVNCETLSKCQPMLKGEQIGIVRTTNGTLVEIIVKKLANYGSTGRYEITSDTDRVGFASTTVAFSRIK